MKLFLFPFLILCLSMPCLANTQGGVIINNGGDTDTFAFTLIGENVASFLRNIGPSSPVSAMAFTQAQQLTYVDAVDTSLGLWAVPKDAINTHVPGVAGGYIRFNRQAWARKNTAERTQLVVHEYLGVMGVYDQADALSLKVTQMYSRGLAGDDAKMMMRLMSAVPIVTKSINGHFVTLGPMSFSCVRIASPATPYPHYNCSIASTGSPGRYEVDGLASILLYSLLEKTVAVCSDSVCKIDVRDFTCSSSSEDLLEASCLNSDRSLFSIDR